MYKSKVLSNHFLWLVIWDLLFAVAVYFLPAMAHVSRFPIYIIEPFRLIILSSIIIGDKRNSVVLALSLPFFSLIMTGHPVFLKMVLISIELLVNVLFFFYLKDKFKYVTVTILMSILLSKTVYYLLKYLFIVTGLMEMSFISTSLFSQCAVSLITSLVFGCLVYNKTSKV